MKLNSIQSNSITFGNLIIGESVTKKLRSKYHSNTFNYEYDKIEQILSMLDIDSKKNIDIILNYKPRDGFYGVVSSKTQGVPNNPAYKCPICPDYRSIGEFDKWVNMWNEAFSKVELKKMDKS